jgi:hypothetical protein
MVGIPVRGIGRPREAGHRNDISGYLAALVASPPMMTEHLMKDDLHRTVWYAYRRAIGTDASWDAPKAFQCALDVLLRQQASIDAPSACREVARMIMTRPRGIGNRGRVASASRLPELRLAAVA